MVRKKVYVTEVNGTRMLDLYSGWNPETGQHKLSLSTLPVKVCSLVSLERLWASHNKLASVPLQFDQLVNLRELFLHRNCFEAIPVVLCRLSRLETLWLSSNKISAIPEEIAQLQSLKRLHLDCNFIEEFPDALCRLTSLEVLYLNNNQLRNISEEVGNMKALQRLYLQHNKITSIPRGICQLTNVRMLLLDHNEITHVKREFQHYQVQRESNSAVISTNNNPFVTPGSKLKLSLSGIQGPSSLVLKSRRHSDQFERIAALERKPRVSLPEGDLKSDVQQIRHHTSHPRYNTLPSVGRSASGRVGFTVESQGHSDEESGPVELPPSVNVGPVGLPPSASAPATLGMQSEQEPL